MSDTLQDAGTPVEPAGDDEPAPEPVPATQRSKSTKDRSPRDTKEQFYRFTYHFYAPVNATRGTFGIDTEGSPGGGGGRRRHQGSGRLRDGDVRAALRHYVRPARFDEAVQWLRRDHVVVLEGRPGSGRRAGAIAMLREATTRLLVVLSPASTLTELANGRYTPGHGYLVVDRTGEDRAVDTDFTWANVRDRVRDKKAYLVVTSTAVVGRATTEAVRHLAWARPPTSEVLRAHLIGGGYAEELVDDLVTELIDALPGDCTLARLAEFSRLISDGKEPADALKEFAEESGRYVYGWFEAERTRREIIDVTTLSFLVGHNERTFESMSGRLEETVAEHMPIKPDPAPPTTDAFVGGRGPRVDGDGLIGVEQIQSSIGTSRVVVFKEEAYQRFVVAKLWDRYPTPFWDAVREWLDWVVGQGDSLEVASGLAWLSAVNFDEVECSYLDRWSWGQLGLPGQVTAAYVLWYMCRDEETARVALETAIRWVNDSDVDRRWTALFAFGGELGVCFPTEAANRLWQLIAQRDDDLWRPGRFALASLFAILTDETRDAGKVLTKLDLQMERFGRATDKPRMQALTMAVALPILSVPNVRTRRPAIVELLHAEPERAAVVARLWAGLICHRPSRREALVALRRGLLAMRDISENPRAEARALGRALDDALPPEEHGDFKEDLSTLEEQLRHGQTGWPAEVLLAFLDAISVTPSQ